MEGRNKDSNGVRMEGGNLRTSVNLKPLVPNLRPLDSLPRQCNRRADADAELLGGIVANDGQF